MQVFLERTEGVKFHQVKFPKELKPRLTLFRGYRHDKVSLEKGIHWGTKENKSRNFSFQRLIGWT